MDKIIKITAFFLLLVICFSVKNASAAIDSSLPIDFSVRETICVKGTKCCLVGGSNTCVSDNTTPCNPCLTDFTGLEFKGEEDCNSVGTEEYKYTPDSTCGYKTETRTCCAGKKWSNWDEDCPKTCPEPKPITWQECTAANGKTGSQSRSVTCNTSTGEWVLGDWGECVAPECETGETKKCPSNKNKIVRCVSGKWSSTCSCENPGNGKVYCMGMQRTDSGSCYHGIWSDDVCEGICCCAQDTPKLFTGVDGFEHPGCWGTRVNAKGHQEPYMWQYSCTCQTADQIRESGGSTGVFKEAY